MKKRALSSELALLARLGVAVVLTDREELQRLRAQARPTRAWREVLLQATLFAGFPRVIAAFDVLRECGGAGAPEPFEALPGPDDPAAGRALFAAIYGDAAGRVREHLVEHHPLLARWIEGHAYGRVLARDGLDAAARELVAVAMLTASGLDRQLASHARGAVRLGARPEEVLAAVEEVAELVPTTLVERAREVVRAFAAEGSASDRDQR